MGAGTSPGLELPRFMQLGQTAQLERRGGNGDQAELPWAPT